MTSNWSVLLGALVALSTLAGCLTESTKVDHPLADAPAYMGPAPGFDAGTGWLAPEPLTLAGLAGNVVLVDFWTYSCINCIRTLPHLTGWYDTYREHGLEIVGVHSPEFDFEKESENVLEAMDRFGIEYPVVQDNDFGIWREYNNRYWPAKYLIDADGEVRYTHFGEGDYEETEQAIRALLNEAGHDGLPPAFEGSQRQQVRGNDITPELYAGYWRQADTVGDGPYQADEDVAHGPLPPVEERLKDKIYLDGTWFHGEEALVATTPGAVALTFRAGAVNVVADLPAASGQCLPVSIDGLPIDEAVRGPDVLDDGDGGTCIRMDGAPRSYDIYEGPVQTHALVFHVPSEFELYTFAFSHYSQM